MICRVAHSVCFQEGLKKTLPVPERHCAQATTAWHHQPLKKIPNQSICTTVPGQFNEKTFPTPNLKIERTHLEKGALNISFCSRQDVDITQNHQSLLFVTRGIRAALTHKPRSRHTLSSCCFSVQLPAAELGFRRGFTAASYKVRQER